MSEVLDFFGTHDAQTYICLKQGGAVGIARYLTSSPTDPRQITPQEVAFAHAAGLGIHFFYEMNPVYAAYFSLAQGAEDCRQAQARLDELGAPDGSVVYFAVDAPPSVIPVGVLDEYFNGVESVVTPRITPGLYGFEAHCDYARTRFPNQTRLGHFPELGREMARDQQISLRRIGVGRLPYLVWYLWDPRGSGFVQLQRIFHFRQRTPVPKLPESG